MGGSPDEYQGALRTLDIRSSSVLFPAQNRPYQPMLGYELKGCWDDPDMALQDRACAELSSCTMALCRPDISGLLPQKGGVLIIPEKQVCVGGSFMR